MQCYTSIWKIICRLLTGTVGKVCWLLCVTTAPWTGREVRLVRSGCWWLLSPSCGHGWGQRGTHGLSIWGAVHHFLLRCSPSLIDAGLKSCTQGAITFKATKSLLLELCSKNQRLGWAQNMWYSPYWTQTIILRSRDTAENLRNLPEVTQLVRGDVLFSPFLIN